MFVRCKFETLAAVFMQLQHSIGPEIATDILFQTTTGENIESRRDEPLPSDYQFTPGEESAIDENRFGQNQLLGS